jgi:hypothetical protein
MPAAPPLPLICNNTEAFRDPFCPPLFWLPFFVLSPKGGGQKRQPNMLRATRGRKAKGVIAGEGKGRCNEHNGDCFVACAPRNDDIGFIEIAFVVIGIGKSLIGFLGILR